MAVGKGGTNGNWNGYVMVPSAWDTKIISRDIRKVFPDRTVTVENNPNGGKY